MHVAARQGLPAAQVERRTEKKKITDGVVVAGFSCNRIVDTEIVVDHSTCESN